MSDMNVLQPPGNCKWLGTDLGHKETLGLRKGARARLSRRGQDGRGSGRDVEVHKISLGRR